MLGTLLPMRMLRRQSRTAGASREGTPEPTRRRRRSTRVNAWPSPGPHVTISVKRGGGGKTEDDLALGDDATAGRARHRLAAHRRRPGLVHTDPKSTRL